MINVYKGLGNIICSTLIIFASACGFEVSYLTEVISLVFKNVNLIFFFFILRNFLNSLSVLKKLTSFVIMQTQL